MQLKQTLLTTALIAVSFALHAQSASTTSPSDLDEIEISSFSNSDWTFYLDEASKTYFIDFETISVNLNDVKVLNSNGEVVLEDKLWDLPVNTIYEIDLGEVKPGDYKVELRTYTGKITKEITIAD